MQRQQRCRGCGHQPRAHSAPQPHCNTTTLPPPQQPVAPKSPEIALNQGLATLHQSQPPCRHHPPRQSHSSPTGASEPPAAISGWHRNGGASSSPGPSPLQSCHHCQNRGGPGQWLPPLTLLASSSGTQRPLGHAPHPRASLAGGACWGWDATSHPCPHPGFQASEQNLGGFGAFRGNKPAQVKL